MNGRGTVMRRSMIGIFLVILVIFSVYFVQARDKGVTDMIKADLQNVSIPSIDAELPARVETATFGLG
jgi:hypothetical protein